MVNKTKNKVSATRKKRMGRRREGKEKEVNSVIERGEMILSSSKAGIRNQRIMNSFHIGHISNGHISSKANTRDLSDSCIFYLITD